MFLFDTNVLSELMKPSPDERVFNWVEQQLKSELFVSAVTRAEIERGIAILPDGRRKQNLHAASTKIFEQFEDRCLVFDETAAIAYGVLCAECKRAGRPIAVEDAQIASIAVVHNLRLATRNVKDFEAIADLDIVNPWGE